MINLKQKQRNVKVNTLFVILTFQDATSDEFLICFSKKKSVERSQNKKRVTPRGQGLPIHQKVLLYFGKVKQKHKPL